MKYFVEFSLLGLASAGFSPAPSLTSESVSTSLGSSNLTRGASCACQKLSRAHGGVIFPSGANYAAETVDSYWDVRTDLSPACVFLPATPNEVSHALEVIGSCNAQFAVRGGGHMCYPGSNNIDGGVLLGLSKLNNVKVNDDTIEVGPGLTWYDVYSALEPYGRVAIGVCNAARLDDENPIAAGMVASITYNVTTKVASASLLGVQEGSESSPSQFANFSAIPATARINRVQTMKKWAAALDSPKQMFRVMYSHKSMTPDPDVLYMFYKIWKEAVDEISDVEGLYPTFVTNVHAPGSSRVAQTNGIGNVWGLEPEPLILWQFSTGWALAQDDLRVQSWSRQLTERLHAINVEKGLASDFIYMGDAGEWQDPFLGFPAENVVRMRDIRASYDPQGIFSRLSWGGFKLGI